MRKNLRPAIPLTEARRKEQDKLFTLQRKYQAVLTSESPVVKELLTDLAEFCRASESTFDADPRIHAFLEGRREVFLYITEFLNLSSQQLWEKRTGTKFQ